MKIRTYLAVLAAVLLAACSVATPIASQLATTTTPGPAIVALPSPSPSVSVLATHAAKPTPKPSAKPAVKPKPAVHHKAAAAKPFRWPAGCGVTKICCIQYAQCKIPPVTSSVWKVTKGCTVAWRKALHRTTCPPGWPPIP